MPIDQITSASLASGVPTRAQLPAGSVLQVVNTYLTTTGSISVPASVSTYTDVTGIAATITPTSVNSKILIFARWFGEFNPQSATYNTMWSLKRNGTVIGLPPQPGSVPIGIHMAALSYWVADADSTPETIYFDYHDSPNSISALTYQVAVSSTEASTLFINRTVSGSTSSGYERGTSSITLMEIAG
jgi:hypothetical protein